MQIQHIQARDVVLAHIAAVAAHLLVAARAECLVLIFSVMVCAGKDNHAHFLIVARKRERVEQLHVRLRREGVAAFRAVDGDFGDAIVLFVDDLVVILNFFPGEVAHRMFLPYCCWPSMPRFKPLGSMPDKNSCTTLE